MKISDYLQVKNKTGEISMERMTVQVTILDVKESYGTIRYLVSPVAGSCSTWVSASRVTIKGMIGNFSGNSL